MLLSSASVDPHRVRDVPLVALALAAGSVDALAWIPRAAPAVLWPARVTVGLLADARRWMPLLPALLTNSRM
ncbi:MAG TPA: hypothetical protein VEF89_19400 [Solirubrobacteraceae bacterium]|nr:hypothetical protein [Solirubrobacteraceae bacterium]